MKQHNARQRKKAIKNAWQVVMQYVTKNWPSGIALTSVTGKHAVAMTTLRYGGEESIDSYPIMLGTCVTYRRLPRFRQPPKAR